MVTTCPPHACHCEDHARIYMEAPRTLTVVFELPMGFVTKSKEYIEIRCVKCVWNCVPS